ncbi:MAG: type VII toxin-antitoxin system HepT family RNase toxin [Bacillota bacterium]|jgi:uncharacterized protein YutE (UPF0331/DUF86 family)
MINRTLIESRLSLIIDLVGQLDSLAESSESDFLSDPRNVGAAESFLRRSLEAVFDIGRHLVAKSGHSDLAKEYKTIAQGLGTLKVVPREFVSTLIQMAGYRNRMVHFYLEITPSELYQLIIARRGDLRRFVDCCVEYLDKVCG